MASLAQRLEISSSLHRHLCPRQVLGVRMGMLAERELGLELPQADKRLLTIVETDGCFADGVSAATGCWVGRRTLRIEDFGKAAATFVDTLAGRAIRITPRLEARETAHVYAPEARSKWEAQLLGYQRMPDEALLAVREVCLKTPVEQIISHPGYRQVCQVCGEEIINEREVRCQDSALCRGCAGQAYYVLSETPHLEPAR